MKKFVFDQEVYKKLEIGLINAGGLEQFSGAEGAKRLLDWLKEFGIDYQPTDWRLSMLEATVVEAARFKSPSENKSDGARLLAQFLTFLQGQQDAVPQHDPIRRFSCKDAIIHYRNKLSSYADALQDWSRCLNEAADGGGGLIPPLQSGTEDAGSLPCATELEKVQQAGFDLEIAGIAVDEICPTL